MRSETGAIHRNSGAAVPFDIMPDVKSAEVVIDRIFRIGAGLVIAKNQCPPEGKEREDYIL